MTFSPEQTELLKAPLNRSNVKERKMAGRTMSYVEGWHVIAEANRIFGFDGWTSETILLQETNRDLVDLTGSNGKYQQWRIGYIAKVRITAGGVSREGTGYGSGMGKPEAVGDAVEGAIKEAETDARKRALMTFGSTFGLALYDKEQSEVVDDSPKRPTTAPTKPQEAQTPITATHTANKPDLVPDEDPDGQVKNWCDKEIAKWKDLTRLPDMLMWQDEREPEISRLLRKSPLMHRYLMDRYEAKKDEILKVSK